MKIDFSEREAECFHFLNLLSQQKNYAVIGGYAVSSFGFPRFSVDLDIVIPEGETAPIKRLISEVGFVLSKEKQDLAYSGSFERYKKGLVSIDLLINAVQSRQTNYSYPYSYIFKNSMMRQVSGWDPFSKARVRVATKEMLIALKIHSMRDADKRDIIMLCYEMPDASKIIDHLKNGPRDKIIIHMNELISVVNNKNLKDSLKGVYALDEKVFIKTVKNCQIVMKELTKQLE